MDWPIIRKRFGLSELAHISGVDVPTIQRWQHRGAIKVRSIGRGRVRTYSISDALHIAVIAEMSVLGLTITGKCADLSAAIVWHIEGLLRDNPSIDALGSLALVPLPAEDDWLMDHNINRALLAGSCSVISLSPIAEGVARRNFPDGAT